MDARYQAPTLSRFLSEDPNFIAAGAPDWAMGTKSNPTYAALSGFVNSKNSNYLANPQNLNTRQAIFGVSGGLQGGGSSASGWVNYLADPQAQNAYSYVRNNPLGYTDSTGKNYVEASLKRNRAHQPREVSRALGHSVNH
jgi:hypothetical protein